MKEIVIPLLFLILISSVVLATCPCNSRALETDNLDFQGTGHQQAGQETGNQSGQGQQETQNQEENLTVQKGRQSRVENVSQLRNLIQQRQQEMNQEMQHIGEGKRNIYQNQNRVRLAVHTLLAMENLTGGIGQNVSQIAREFNNSVQATIRAEERIQTRNWFVRFFVGGDAEAAQDIEQEVNRNRQGIQELKQLREECDCDEEVKNVIQEQIQNMEQEQNRLQQLAQNEKEDKGIFGWFFGWLR